MLEAILIGIVIIIAFIILLIIVIGAIKGIRKNKHKEENESINEEIISDSQELELEMKETLDLNREDLSLIQEQVKNMSEKETLVISLNQGEGIVIGEGEYPCGNYVVEITNGENQVKIRTSRYVNLYDNGATITFESKQKVTPISASVTLKKID